VIRLALAAVLVAALALPADLMSTASASDRGRAHKAKLVSGVTQVGDEERCWYEPVDPTEIPEELAPGEEVTVEMRERCEFVPIYGFAVRARKGRRLTRCVVRPCAIARPRREARPIVVIVEIGDNSAPPSARWP